MSTDPEDPEVETALWVVFGPSRHRFEKMELRPGQQETLKLSKGKLGRGGQNLHKNEKNGIFKMPPKIVVILVLGTPEHLELGLILQN